MKDLNDMTRLRVSKQDGGHQGRVTIRMSPGTGCRAEYLDNYKPTRYVQAGAKLPVHKLKGPEPPGVRGHKYYAERLRALCRQSGSYGRSALCPLQHPEYGRTNRAMVAFCLRSGEENPKCSRNLIPVPKA